MISAFIFWDESIHVMTSDSDHDEASSDNDVPSPEPSIFEEVLYEMLVTHIEALPVVKFPNRVQRTIRSYPDLVSLLTTLLQKEEKT
jgi:hypothetical protein